MADKRNLILSFGTRAVVIIVLLAVSGATAKWLFETRVQPEESEHIGELPRVRVLSVQRVPVQRRWVGYGVARAKDSAEVPAEVIAIVAEVPEEIEAGRRVEIGSLIARLDDRDFIHQRDIIQQRIAETAAELRQLDLEETSWARRKVLAQEALAIEQRNYDRFRNALGSGGVQQLEVDQAEDALKTKERAFVIAEESYSKIAPRRLRLEAQNAGLDAELQMANKNIERCRILSPIDGVLEDVDVELGESMVSGQRVARVVNLTKIEVPLRLPASARLDVEIGDTVLVRAVGSDDREWPGRVSRVAPIDDDVTRTATVYVEIDNNLDDPNALLAPGRFVEGTVTGHAPEERMVLPRRAVSGNRALLVKDGVLTGLAIDVDYHIRARLDLFELDDEDWVVVRNDLPDNSLIVLDPSGTERVGLRVQPVTVSRAARRDDDGGAS